LDSDLKLCLLASFKRTPRIDKYSFYGPVLEELNSIYPRHIVMGDVNVDILRDTSASRIFLKQFNALSLTVVKNVEPTHFRLGERSTLIDFFATNAPEEATHWQGRPNVITWDDFLIQTLMDGWIING
jgi:hypothetical protein